MDFYDIKERSLKKDVIEIYPDFQVDDSHDLMIKGGAFYAVWDEQKVCGQLTNMIFVD